MPTIIPGLNGQMDSIVPISSSNDFIKHLAMLNRSTLTIDSNNINTISHLNTSLLELDQTDQD